MKINRLLAITLHLINRKEATARDLAERFEVSIRTIQRDMDALMLAGVPIFTERGKNGGYRIVEEYTLDRQFFDHDELQNLQSVFGEISDLLGHQKLRTTHDKVRNLSQKVKTRNHEPLVMDLTPWGFTEASRSLFQTVYKGILEFRRINLVYQDARAQRTSRQVDPLSIIIKGNSWYLYGHCLLRRDVRIFKLTRIEQVKITGQVFVADSYPPYQQQSQLGDQRQPTMFVLRFQADGLESIRDYTGPDSLLPMPDGSYLGFFPFPEDEWVYSWLLSLGPKAELLEPKHARKIIRKRAKALSELYGAEPG